MFPADDLTRMQAAQVVHLPDVCHRSVYSRTQSDSGAEVEVWTENITDIPCGIDQDANRTNYENVKSNMTVVLHDAIARLPISQAESWDVKDRFILTQRFGSVITPITYGIAAPIVRGPSGIRLILEKVEV